MAAEARRGCGYRKVGGLYLVGPAMGEDCHRLPLPVDNCPTCGHGIKVARGWQWVGREVLAPGCSPHLRDARHCPACPVCNPEKVSARCGLLWVGEEFYATADRFIEEAATLGISRRIAVVPREFELGTSWVLLGHRLAISATMPNPLDPTQEVPTRKPGIFSVFKPLRVELILKQSDATEARIAEEARRGVTVVPVPDDDPDHVPGTERQGTLALPGGEE